MNEELARSICVAAVFENRAADLLICLMDGGSATIDRSNGKLVTVSGEQIKQMAERNVMSQCPICGKGGAAFTHIDCYVAMDRLMANASIRVVMREDIASGNVWPEGERSLWPDPDNLP